MRLTVRAACAAAALAIVACGTDPGSGVGPPAEVDLAEVDPEVAALLTDLHDRAVREPDSGQTRGRLGMAYEANGFPRAAERCYEEAAALDPREARWPYFLGGIRAARGDLIAAIETLERTTLLAPDYLPARLSAAEWLLADGRPAEARAKLEQAQRLAGDDAWVELGLARAALDSGDTGTAIEILEELAAIQDADPLAVHTLGRALARVGATDRAREILARVPPGPRRPWPDPWVEAKREYLVGFGARVLRADELIASGRSAEALPILEALHAQRPGEPAIATNLGVLLRAAGRADEARRILEDAVERNPGHAVLRLNLAASYERAGEPLRALDQIDAVLATEPEQADAWLRRGILLARIGRGTEALAALDEAAERSGDAAEPCLLGGIQAAELARWDDARRRLECATGRDPDRLEAWLTLAPVRARLGDRTGAAAALDQATRIRPADPRLAAVSARVEAILTGRR